MSALKSQPKMPTKREGRVVFFVCDVVGIVCCLFDFNLLNLILGHYEFFEGTSRHGFYFFTKQIRKCKCFKRSYCRLLSSWSTQSVHSCGHSYCLPCIKTLPKQCSICRRLFDQWESFKPKNKTRFSVLLKKNLQRNFCVILVENVTYLLETNSFRISVERSRFFVQKRFVDCYRI